MPDPPSDPGGDQLTVMLPLPAAACGDCGDPGTVGGGGGRATAGRSATSCPILRAAVPACAMRFPVEPAAPLDSSAASAVSFDLPTDTDASARSAIPVGGVIVVPTSRPNSATS